MCEGFLYNLGRPYFAEASLPASSLHADEPFACNGVALSRVRCSYWTSSLHYVPLHFLLPMFTSRVFHLCFMLYVPCPLPPPLRPPPFASHRDQWARGDVILPSFPPSRPPCPLQCSVLPSSIVVRIEASHAIRKMWS